MNPPLLNAYMSMLPRLQAEEDMRAVNVVAAGTGSLRDSDRRTYLADLRRAATSGLRRSEKPTRKDLAAIGIKVEEVKV